MPKDLSHIRESLSKKMKDVWKNPEMQDFRDALSEVMTKATQEDFRACMSGKIPDDIRGEIFYRCKICALPAPITCLTLVAKKYNLDKKFADAWTKVPEQLKKDMMGIEALWMEADRTLAESVSGNLELSRFYNLCVNSKFEEVAAELGMEVVPITYRDCMSCVAKYTDLAKAYKRMWGKRA